LDSEYLFDSFAAWKKICAQVDVKQEYIAAHTESGIIFNQSIFCTVNQVSL